MKNQTKFVSASQFFVASVFLLIGLFKLESALSFGGLENNFLADNWETPLAIFLTLIFGLGWWLEEVIENLVLSKGRKIATIVLLCLLLVFVSVEFGSLVLTPRGFWQSAIGSSGYILMSGFFFHFSAMRPDVVAKLQMHN